MNKQDFKNWAALGVLVAVAAGLCVGFVLQSQECSKEGGVLLRTVIGFECITKGR